MMKLVYPSIKNMQNISLGLYMCNKQLFDKVQSMISQIIKTKVRVICWSQRLIQTT